MFIETNTINRFSLVIKLITIYLIIRNLLLTIGKRLISTLTLDIRRLKYKLISLSLEIL